jgi:hypothetical protein
MEVITISHLALVLLIMFIVTVFAVMVSRIKWDNIEYGDKIFLYDKEIKDFYEEEVDFLSSDGWIETAEGHRYTFWDYLTGKILI